MARNQTGWARFVGVSILYLAASCSRPPAKVNVPLSEIPAQVAQAACGAVTDCNAAWASAFFGANDCATLFAAMLLNGPLANIQAAVDVGTVQYDSSALAACWTATRALGCRYYDLPYVPECEAMLQGTRAEGQTCSITFECAGDLYCKSTTPGTCPGTCSKREIAGAACDVSAHCAENLFCSVMAGNKCTSKVAVGGNCWGGTAPEECVSNAFCWGGNSSTPGKCLTYDSIFSGALSANCAVVPGQLCGSGLTCGYDPGLAALECREPIPSGGACPWALPDACPPSEYCNGVNPLTVTSTGTCHLLPVADEACVAPLSFGKRCAKDHVCISSTNKCAKLQPNGVACSSDAMCLSGSCPSGTCAPIEVCAISP